MTKRKISILLPYRRAGETLEVYLQKRSPDSKTLPGRFSFWGGGIEINETPEEALVREVKEELGMTIEIKSVELFNHYECLKNTKDIFIFEPAAGWENSIVVGEGEYGKWFTLDEALSSEDVILEDKVVLNDLERVILKKPVR